MCWITNAQINVVFPVFMALFVIFLNLLWWNLSKLSQHIAPSGNTNFKPEKVWFVKAIFRFFETYVFYDCHKTGLVDFHGKQAPTNKSKIFINSQPNFTEFHLRKREKIHCQFCFLCSCWHKKIWRFPWSVSRLPELPLSVPMRS